MTIYLSAYYVLMLFVIDNRTHARKIKPGKVVAGLEPHFRGVEGHRSEGTHGKASISLSVLKPVTKSIALNRSFKVTMKR